MVDITNILSIITFEKPQLCNLELGTISLATISFTIISNQQSSFSYALL
jgi:hypothetical protein